jgi:hypothetical protein
MCKKAYEQLGNKMGGQLNPNCLQFQGLLWVYLHLEQVLNIYGIHIIKGIGAL